MAGPFASEGLNELARAVEAYADAVQVQARQIAAGIAAIVEQHTAALSVSPEENQP